MTENKIKASLKVCEDSTKKLKEGLNIFEKESHESLAKKEILFDSCVKRFEVCFEYTWKLLKIAAEYQGSEAPGPRPAIQEGLKFHWIEDEEFWAEALDARNGSVHDYFGITEERYLKIMKIFTDKIQKMLKKIADSPS